MTTIKRECAIGGHILFMNDTGIRCVNCEYEVIGEKMLNDKMTMLEKMCRIICKAEGVDPDIESVGIGCIIPNGQPYKLWEARIRAAKALIAEGFGDV